MSLVSRTALGFLIVCTLMAPISAAEADSVSAAPGLPRFTFLPALHVSADISRFFFRKNDYFRKVYLLESEISIEPVWVRYGDRVGLVSVFDLNPNMGVKGKRNVLFDPMGINFALVTILEFDLKAAVVQLGEDHRCFHEIDRKDFPTVYWNMLYLAVGSPNMRLADFGPRALAAGEWTLRERLSWYGRWGVFLKGFFGLVQDGNVDFENNRVHEASLRLRYGLARRRRTMLSLVGRSRVGLWREREADGGDSKTYWQQQFGFEAGVHCPPRGFLFFAKYTLDGIPLYRGKPRFSRDKLLELGFRVYQ